jgi:hypothetical protein
VAAAATAIPARSVRTCSPCRGLYDYRTTAPGFWPDLERLNSL